MASVKASDDGLKIIDKLRKQKGWNKDDKRWIDKSQTSEPTLKRFWQKIPISPNKFAKICKAVGETDWQSITEEFGNNKPRKLQEILYSLNYDSQSNLFKQFWKTDETRKSGCFLVHGERGSCQELLINRLFYHDFGIDLETPHKFTINLPERGDVYIEDLWQILGEKFGCTAKVIDIVESAYNYWQDETVILAFKNLDRLCKTEHDKLLDEFCRPLMERINRLDNKSKPYFLIFLVDNQGTAGNWQMNSYQPQDLTRIEVFDKGMLNMWLSQDKNQVILADLIEIKDYIMMVKKEKREKMEKILDRVWQNSRQGVPEFAIAEICNLCGCNWDSIQQSFDL